MKFPLTDTRRGAYIGPMTQRSIWFALVLALSATPSLAADDETGKSLMERGAELFLKGLQQEMEPKLEDLRGMAEKFGPSMRSFIEQMGPAFVDMVDEVKDWSRYEAPEMLPNGDIIIRRKPDPAPDEAPKEAPKEDGSTDL